MNDKNRQRHIAYEVLVILGQLSEFSISVICSFILNFTGMQSHKDSHFSMRPCPIRLCMEQMQCRVSQ